MSDDDVVGCGVLENYSYYDTDDDGSNTLVLMVAVAEEGQKRKKERQQGDHYLRRADLLPDPRHATPWEAIYTAGNDHAFILTTGFDVKTFHVLLERFQRWWDADVVPRDDVRVAGVPRPSRRSLSAAGALALGLHFLNATMPTQCLQQIFAITPAVCSRYLIFALNLLRRVLLDMPEATIRWPTEENTFEEYSKMIQMRHPLLQRGFCFVDGLNIPVAESLDDDVQNAYYNGWTCSHYCSSVFAFAPDGCIIFCALNAPGSWHDAAVAHGLYQRLLRRTPDRYYAIADTAFPRNYSRIEGRIKTPLKKNSRLPAQLQAEGRMHEYEELMAFNSQLVSARQAAEWGMRSLQGSFARLKLPLPTDDHGYRYLVLEVCSRLHQVRTRLVHINQIKTVYEKIWCGNDPDALMYESFTNLMFKDIEKRDRIARYYQVEHGIIDERI